MKSPEIIKQVLQIPITNYLASIGITPVNQAGQQLFYCSPKTNEKTPSLAVNPVKNVFYDWSGEGKGDILSLVQYLNGCTFLEAVQVLENYQLNPPEISFSFSGQSSVCDSTGVEITNVKPLQHQALIQYVEKRGISMKIASRYLREVHYETKGKKYFAAGFPNDSGGYELRNPYFKGSISPKGITTYTVNSSKSVLLFEGFFDFLSALEYYKQPTMPASVIVLNSLTNLSKVIPDLQRFGKVSAFLDTDEAGRKAFAKIKSSAINVIDFSNTYNGFKDFNEYMTMSRTF
ncbi:mobilization protein [Spirosoma sp. KCTC 42546]|uniref:toprim domain-containing protein n=1 Tax=Spirosoma sp. KCTC 42546 TaxID=2520506 RepID=UPI00115BEFCB|nr:toprim domain-containing protein [Spirosoma sp. KCTC 42546]QDK77766.1 mobilization protein [Spirosoma sp. KCTC 42546]